MNDAEPRLIFRCPTCGRTRELPESLRGKRGLCNDCGSVHRIDGLSAPEAPEPEPPPSTSEPQPPRPRHRKPRPWLHLVRTYTGESSQVQEIAVLLIVLSVADLFMTYALLRRGPMFFEANPLARWFFDRWNIAGMAAFKFGLMAGVIALGEVIERHRPGRGRLVLAVGCLGAAYAVITGLRLYLHHA